METFKCMLRSLKDEVRLAEHYLKHANKYKETDKSTADVFHKLSLREIEDALIIKNHVNEKMRSLDDSEHSKIMKHIWDFECEEISEEISEIQKEQSKY